MQSGRYILVSAVALIFSLTTCANQNSSKVTKGRDAILFERATTAVQQKKFDVARITLQTLVATYPDSEYVNRAKQMLQDPRIARCGGESFPNTPASDCDSHDPSPRHDQ
jgi:predicted Zn-dependent protease